jgi:hypothetical protein
VTEPAVFRTRSRPRIIAVFGALFVFLAIGGAVDSISSLDGVARVAGAAPMVLLAVAIAWASFWGVPRAAVIAGDDGVTVRGTFSSRTVPWDDVERFAFTRVAHFGKGLLVTRDGTLISMSSITTKRPVDELNALLEVRRGDPAGRASIAGP